MLLKCNGKHCYDKKTAQTARNKRFKEDHVALRIYFHDKCGLWHLTSEEPYRKEWRYKNKKYHDPAYRTKRTKNLSRR